MCHPPITSHSRPGNISIRPAEFGNSRDWAAGNPPCLATSTLGSVSVTIPSSDLDNKEQEKQKKKKRRRKSLDERKTLVEYPSKHSPGPLRHHSASASVNRHPCVLSKLSRRSLADVVRGTYPYSRTIPVINSRPIIS
ncbi:hypothetical protein LX36DRAFT_651935 [Colletotrichum falcatum]|nr:hypothetical protein LX36DRAFT_651935 [Colletotrichum falcatum]